MIILYKKQEKYNSISFIQMQKQKIQQSVDPDRQIYVHLFPFRAVLPYHFKYQTFAKSRWYGKPLLETLVKQFKAYDQAYYKESIQAGRITINNKQVPIDYTIKNGDKLIHSALRQEPPILDIDVEIIADDQDYLVVNKPPSFTVHTGGGFHYNTLSSILEIQKGYKDLFILHRLDRLTSGLIIFGKTKDKPAIFHKQNQNAKMKKMYFARVTGNFPWKERTLFAQIECVSHKDGVYKVTRQVQEQQPQKQQIQEHQHQHKQQQPDKKQLNELKQQQHKQGEQDKAKTQTKNVQKDKKNKKGEDKQKQSNPDLKLSKTLFRKVFYDEKTNSTLVECYPISGRTHQIRVHLQFLGFPIINDVVYGGPFIGNNIISFMKAKSSLRNNDDQQVKCKIQGSKKVKLDENQSSGHNLLKSQADKQQNEKNQLSVKKLQQLQKSQLIDSNKSAELIKLKSKLQNEWDYKTKPWEICLHSYQYQLQGKIYQTSKPYWASPDFTF